MSTQTASALKPDWEPVTPVIIKVGGDNSGDNGGDVNKARTLRPVSISIDSDLLHLKEPVSGPSWASSLSTRTGRINNVTVIDGSTTIITTITPPPPELASVTIMFGPAQLMAMETGVADTGEVFLLITSPQKPFTKEDQKMSTATFPNKIKSVVVMVGDTEKLNYEFKSEDATVQIDFNLTEAKHKK